MTPLGTPLEFAGWLVVWGFALRAGWSTAGWLRRRLLSDRPSPSPLADPKTVAAARAIQTGGVQAHLERTYKGLER